MLLHYLKIAWRNLLKYKTQTIVSIVGLAIGFTAFSFTMSWIRYEMSYDKFNPHAENIYKVIRTDKGSFDGQTTYGLANFLRTNFPEVAAACNAMSGQFVFSDDVKKDEWTRFVQDARFSVFTDTSFFSVFYPEQKIKFPNPIPKRATIFARSIAAKWNITAQQFGQPIDSLNLVPIGIVDDKPLPSNVAFGWMSVDDPASMVENPIALWTFFSGNTYFRLHKGTSADNIRQKLDSLRVLTTLGEEIRSYEIYPLRTVHYLHPSKTATIKFEALKQFSIVALLVIIGALINYIMLFISRVKIRIRELALNRVNGASYKQVLLLLFFEFMLVLLGAIFVGGVLTELLFPSFGKFSLIVAPKNYFMVSLIWYSLIIILVSTAVTFVLINKFVRQSIRENIQTEIKSYYNFKINFTHIAILVQLAIGILLIFSSAVIFNQYHLMNQRVGYNRNKLMLFGTNYDNIPVSEIKQIPGIGNFIINADNIFDWSLSNKLNTIDIKDTDGKTETYSFQNRSMNTDAREFLEIPLLEGRDMLPNEQYAFYINETGARMLGNKAIGKMVYEQYPIIGVIPDLQVENPLKKIEPTLYSLSRENDTQMCSNIMFRCENDSIEKKVHDWFKKRFPETQFEGGGLAINYYVRDIDELFKEFTKSERNLLKLIGIMTAVAILIAVFGIYSMITLACSQRRKEIAIRKVNGARVKEILALFYRQHFAVTIIACMVAFPVGVYVMQRWLEQYTRRVSMEWWLFAGVFVLVVAIVFASIIFRVWKAAGENPADVVKSE